MLYDALDAALWLIARTGCLIVGHSWQPLTDKRLCDICRRCGKLHVHFRSPK